MNEQQKAEFISYKLSRSKEMLDEVAFLIQNNYLHTAVNRLYYACFHAVSALLYNDDINARKHSGVKQMFGAHFIVTGIISKDAGKFYSEIFELRQESDYENFVEFAEDEVRSLLVSAIALIAEVERSLVK